MSRRWCWWRARGVPADNLKDFVAYLKANEKKVTEADAGVGSISNLACSVFHSVADVHPTVASYRGTPQATMDLVAGTVDFGCNQIVNIVPHIKTGKLKAFAVTGDKRSPMLPDVPTTAEAGLPQFNLTVWFGLSAPKGTPKPIIDKVNKALGVALNDPNVVKRFADSGLRRGAAGTDAAPPISTSSTRTKSRSGPRCSAGSAWAPSSELRAWQPARGVRIIAGTPPGGGLDRVARALVKAIGEGEPARRVGRGGQRAGRRRAQGVDAGHRQARRRRACDRDLIAQSHHRFSGRRRRFRA